MNFGIRQASGPGPCTLCVQWVLVNHLPRPGSPRQASGVLRAHFGLKIAPVCTLLSGGRDYRINSSHPGWALRNSLSSLSLGVDNR